MKINKIHEDISKDAQLHQAVEGALKDLNDHAGQAGYRHLYDQAVHVLGAIKQAGFSIVRRRSKQ